MFSNPYVESTRAGVFAGQMSDENERRAFFINLYNCLTIHALADMADESGLPASPIKVDDMWGTNAYGEQY